MRNETETDRHIPCECLSICQEMIMSISGSGPDTREWKIVSIMFDVMPMKSIVLLFLNQENARKNKEKNIM